MPHCDSSLSLSQIREHAAPRQKPTKFRKLEYVAEAVITADWAIEAPALNSAAPAERSPKGDSVSANATFSGDIRQHTSNRRGCLKFWGLFKPNSFVDQ